MRRTGRGSAQWSCRIARYVPGRGARTAWLAVSGKVFVLEAWPEGAPAKLRQKAVLTTLPELARQIEPSVRLDPPDEFRGRVAAKGRRGGEWILLHNRSLRDTWRGHINTHVSRLRRRDEPLVRGAGDRIAAVRLCGRCGPGRRPLRFRPPCATGT